MFGILYGIMATVVDVLMVAMQLGGQWYTCNVIWSSLMIYSNCVFKIQINYQLTFSSF